MIPQTVAHQATLSMGILQAGILEWVAVYSSRGSSQPRYLTQVSHITGGFLPSEEPGSPLNHGDYEIISVGFYFVFFNFKPLNFMVICFVTMYY